MADFEIATSAHLSVPPATVWGLLEDRDKAPGWLEGILSVGEEDGDLLFRRTRRGEPLRGQLVRVEPQRRLVLRLVEPAPLLREMWVEIALAGAEGGTDYAIHLKAQPRPLASVLAPVLRLRTEVALVRAIGGFRALLEDRVERDRARSRTSRRALRPPTPEETRLAAQMG